MVAVIVVIIVKFFFFASFFCLFYISKCWFYCCCYCCCWCVCIIATFVALVVVAVVGFWIYFWHFTKNLWFSRWGFCLTKEQFCFFVFFFSLSALFCWLEIQHKFGSLITNIGSHISRQREEFRAKKKIKKKKYKIPTKHIIGYYPDILAFYES